MPERPRTALLALAALLMAGGAMAQDVPPPSERLAEVEARLAVSREDAALYAEDVAALDARLAALGRERIEAAADVQRHEATLTAIEDRLATLERREAAAAATLDGRRDTVAAVVAALAHVAKRPPEALMALPGTAAEVRHTGILLAALVPALETEAADLGRELAALAALRQDLADEGDNRLRAAADLEERRAAVAALMAETAGLRSQRADERDAALAEAVALAAQAADLRALILRLQTAEAVAVTPPAWSWDGPPLRIDKPEPAVLAAIAPAAGTVEGEPGVVAPLAPTLRLPAAGTITRNFGDTGGDGASSRGLVVATRADAQVVAPSAGRVVYAGAFKELGQLLILAHGDEYHSVLAGFARIDAVVGQSLTAGEPVGIMGAGDGGEAALYVELRRNGEPVDPLPWLRTAFSEDIR